MRRMLLPIVTLVAGGLWGLAAAHDAGHGPKLTDAPRMGGVLSAVVAAKDAKLGPKAAAVHKAELVRLEAGAVEVHVFDLAMQHLSATRLAQSATAKLIVEVGGKTTVTSFKLVLQDGVYTGTSPTPRAKPYNIDVHFQEGKGKGAVKLLAAFDNLD